MKIRRAVIVAIVALLNFSEAARFQNHLSGILPTPENCGRQTVNASDVVNGEAILEEFPWLVYIPLQSHVHNPGADIRCAGALIGKRYVLFSSTCLQFVLSEVHIGRHDLSENNVLKVAVENRTVSKDRNYVLARLARDVEFSNAVQPICLPWDDFQEAAVGDNVYTSGWGLKNIDKPASETKKKVSEAIVAKSECANSTVTQEDLLCVKVKDNTVVSVCSGDEGSPIMAATGGQWVMYGMIYSTFENFKACSVEKPVHGLKINDDNLDWIAKNVEL